MGGFVLGNRYNDVWDKATITDIQDSADVEEVFWNFLFGSFVKHFLGYRNFGTIGNTEEKGKIKYHRYSRCLVCS